jgi:beta-mannosidase
MPNGEGKPNSYPLTIDIDGQRRLDTITGFKSIRWLPNEGAAPNNAPWICEVNGKPIFLQGVNWTPVRQDYAAVKREDYARLIDLYRDAGVNLFRVWGGSFPEKEDFYQLCDAAGILIWSEFPLSSSGIDNAAPTDPNVIDELCKIATDYIRRRGHHPCHLLWCGGNELFGEPGKPGGRPHDLTHPAMAAMAKVVEEEDPGVRFIPASPSGPTFSYDAKSAGQHLHEDVHGPWNWGGDVKSWHDFWQGDDSLFHSEFGFPAASPMDILEKFRGDYPLWPPNRHNPYWVHSALWWIQDDRFKDELKDLPPEQALPKLIELSQKLQADMLSTAAKLIKSSFPKCGGMVLWMGHDCFPCPSNTSIVDFLGRPKPAFHALAEVWKANPEDLKAKI